MTTFHEPHVVSDPGIGSEEVDELNRELEVLRARISGLTEATRRIYEDLDAGAVLQGTVDSARALTGARYGALLMLDPLGGIEALITSGITSEEAKAIKAEPKGLGLLGFLNEIQEPLRLRNLAGHPRSIGFPKGHPPMGSFLGTPIFHRGERLGNIYLTEKESGREFTKEDEETIVLFASHAAMAISNARRYKEEAQARAEMEALNQRYARLTRTTRILSETLDVDAVLTEIVDGARVLTGADYGLITTLDESGKHQHFGASGLTPEERRLLAELPRGAELLEYFYSFPDPWRVANAAAQFGNHGLPFRATLCVPMYFRDARVGNFYLANGEGGAEFTQEDEALMTAFAAQAAVAVVNARAFEAERRAKAYLEALVETSPVGVLVFNAKTMALLSINQETRHIVRGLRGLGSSQNELLEALGFRYPDGQKIPPEDLPTTKAIRSGQSVRAEEMMIDLPDGQTIRTIVNATPVFSEEGEVVSVIATIQDMTPLERVERLRTEFISMVSDELRTPLAAIKGSATTMLGASSTFDQSEMRHFFQVIDEQADRMRGLIGDLLDTAQIEAGRLSVATEPVDAAYLVEEARREFLRGGATNFIETCLPPDLPSVDVEPRRMLQVLNNLFTYASIYSPYGSTIRVSASADDSYVSISVVDEGEVVPAEHMPHLFRKFYPLDLNDGSDSAAVRKPGSIAVTAGRSLGLRVCKGIVEAHGGRIWAESGGPGLGTRFTLTIPSVKEDGDGPAPDSGRLPTAPGQERILAVDNEAHMLVYLRRTLREAGYNPIVTGNPKDAERLIETDKPHLVLLNLGPGGADMMNEIRGLTDAPVILMSGQADEEDSALAFDMGADDYILKPFSPIELVARIKAALRRQSAPERAQAHKPYLAGDLEIDYSERRVTVAGRPVQLTSTEYRLLFDLSTNAGRVLSHDQLLRRVWGSGYEGDTQPVRTYVKNLRRKLEDDPRNPTYIFTEPRVGYRMAKSEEGGGSKRLRRTRSVANDP